MSRTSRLDLVGVILLFGSSVLAGSCNESEPAVPLVPRRPFTSHENNRRQAQKLYGLAVLHERANRLVEAMRVYEKAEKLDPDSAAIPRALFGLYLALDRTEDALNACRQVLKLDPDDCQTAYLYARQLRGLDRKAEAIRALELAVKSPRLKERGDLAAQIWFDLGVLYEDATQWIQAERAFREVVALLEQPKGVLDSGKYSREEIVSQCAETLERIGKLCLKAKKIPEAIRAFEQAKAKDPLRASRLALHLAEVYRDQKKYDKALEQVEIYLTGLPQGTEAYEMRIALQRELGREPEILNRLETATGRDPNNVQLKLLYARELRRARRTNEALRIYNTLLEFHVTADVYRGLFDLLRDRGAVGIEAIIDQLDTAMTKAAGDEERNIEASSSDARRVRAMLQVLRDDAGLVRQILPAAVIRAGRKRLHYTTRGILATLAARTKQLEQAEMLYRSCLDRPGGLGTTEAEVYFGLLRVLRLQRKHADTVQLCNEGLRVAQRTNRILFHTELVTAHLALGNFKEALQAADDAVTDASKTQLLMCKRIRIDALLQAGEKQKALAECLELLKEYNSGSDLRDVRYTLSNVYHSMHRHEEAEEQLQLILQVDPNDATANNDLGYFWADRNKNLDEAERMIRKAIELDRQQRNSGSSTDPDADKENAAYVDSLGWVLFRKGKLDEARLALERASTLPHGEDDPVVWDHLGDVYYKLKETSRAVEAWKKAIRLYEQGVRRKSDRRYQEIQEKVRRVTTR